MTYGEYRRNITATIACPKCRAAPGARCAMGYAGSDGDMHAERFDAYPHPVATMEPRVLTRMERENEERWERERLHPRGCACAGCDDVYEAWR